MTIVAVRWTSYSTPLPQATMGLAGTRGLMVSGEIGDVNSRGGG